MGCCDFFLSVMRVVGRVHLCVECVFRRVYVLCLCLLYTPVAILSAVFCVICSVLMFVSDANDDHMVETYSMLLRICIVLRVFCCCDFYVFVVCEFGVKSVLVFLS